MKNVIKNTIKNFIKHHLSLFLLFCLSLVSCDGQKSGGNSSQNLKTNEGQSSSLGSNASGSNVLGTPLPDGLTSSNTQNPTTITSSTQGLTTSNPSSNVNSVDLQKWQKTLNSFDLSFLSIINEDVPSISECDSYGTGAIYWSCMYQKAYLSSVLTAQATRVKQFRCSYGIYNISIGAFFYSYSGPKPPLSLACQVTEHHHHNIFEGKNMYPKPRLISFSSEAVCQTNHLSKGLDDRLNHYRTQGYNCTKDTRQRGDYGPSKKHNYNVSEAFIFGE